MRIIAGVYKGRILKSARKLDIRPATDRVKETIFNILQNKLQLDQSNVLDLFAGTGSLGLEAISRGAKQVIFVDSSKDSADLIRANITSLNCEDKCKVIKTDAYNYIEKVSEKFDLIFADPPYSYEYTSLIPEKIFNYDKLSTGGFLVIEHIKKISFEKYKPFLKKEFGNTTVSFFEHIKMEKT